MRKKRFKMGEHVYLTTGNEKVERIITQISNYPGGRKYELSCGMETSWHYDLEFTREPDKRSEIKGYKKNNVASKNS